MNTYTYDEQLLKSIKNDFEVAMGLKEGFCPLRTFDSLENVPSLWNNVLHHDILPEGCLSRYPNNINGVFVVPKRDAAVTFLEPDSFPEIIIPTYQMAINPAHDYNDILLFYKRDDYQMASAMLNKAQQSFMKQLDCEVLKVIEQSCNSKPSISFSKNIPNHIIKLISNGYTLIMHPNTWEMIFDMISADVQEIFCSTSFVKAKNGGCIKFRITDEENTTDILVSDLIQENSVIRCKAGKELGVVVHRKSKSCYFRTENDLKRLKVNTVFWIEVGMAILNPSLVSCYSWK